MAWVANFAPRGVGWPWDVATRRGGHCCGQTCTAQLPFHSWKCILHSSWAYQLLWRMMKTCGREFLAHSSWNKVNKQEVRQAFVFNSWSPHWLILNFMEGEFQYNICVFVHISPVRSFVWIRNKAWVDRHLLVKSGGKFYFWVSPTLIRV